MKLYTRLERLEARMNDSVQVYAVALTDCDRVLVLGTQQELTSADFAQRYAGGVIVKRLASELWDAL